MRKHLFPLFLILCLLLCSCKGQEPPTTESTADTSAATTESTVAPTEAEEQSPSVKVDFSAYAPAESLTPLYSRLRAEFIPDLESSDSYGAIYPFPGSILYDVSQEGYVGSTEALYGFVDAQGRIIADPSYISVNLLRNNADMKNSSLWVFEKSAAVTVHDEGLASEYSEYTRQVGFATGDGSFVSPCIYTSLELWEDRILAFLPRAYNEPASFHIYDTQGKLMGSSEQFAVPNSLGDYSSDFSYGDGLYVIPTTLTSEEGYLIYEYYFADESGNVVLGPYRNARPFYKGKAPVYEEDYYFIDRSGNCVSPHYDYIDTYMGESYNPFYSASEEQEDGRIINTILTRDGIPLIESETYIVRQPNGEFYHYSNDGKSLYYYDSNGTLLWEHADCSALTRELIEYNMEVYSHPCVENLRTGERLELPYTEGYFSTLGVEEDPILLFCHWEESGSSYRLFDSTFTEIPCDGNPYKNLCYLAVGSGVASLVTHEKDKSLDIYLGGHSLFGTYPPQKVLRGICMEDGTAILTDKDCTRIYNKDGDLIFRYPLLSNTED